MYIILLFYLLLNIIKSINMLDENYLPFLVP